MSDPRTIANRIQVAKHAPDQKARRQATLLLVQDAEDLLGQLFVVSREFTAIRAQTESLAAIVGVLIVSAPEQTLRLSMADIAALKQDRDIEWKQDGEELVVRYQEVNDDAVDGSGSVVGDPDGGEVPVAVGGNDLDPQGQALDVSGLREAPDPVPDLRVVGRRRRG